MCTKHIGDMWPKIVMVVVLMFVAILVIKHI